jgi:hypothetical protein
MVTICVTPVSMYLREEKMSNFYIIFGLERIIVDMIPNDFAY